MTAEQFPPAAGHPPMLAACFERSTLQPAQCQPGLVETPMRAFSTAICVLALGLSAGCSSVYYNALEKIGYAKREVLVGRVEDTAQSDAGVLPRGIDASVGTGVPDPPEQPPGGDVRPEDKEGHDR